MIGDPRSSPSFPSRPPSRSGVAGGPPRGPPRLSKDVLRRWPKAELHVHLDGCLRPQTMLELARASSSIVCGRRQPSRWTCNSALGQRRSTSLERRGGPLGGPPATPEREGGREGKEGELRGSPII